MTVWQVPAEKGQQKTVVFNPCIPIVTVYVAIYPHFAGHSKYQIAFVVFWVLKPASGIETRKTKPQLTDWSF
ncbi:hypothetical protein BJF95_06620 [Rhizobium oryziradicis]|uniref:Uncharacterized protein n=1 Tax=Rhizobium oryziradicis TaxID=1867956 RepID=A0A1Q8ZQF8_9HYPH|nr:hypothetical protein BJF95_06620 [Rhizobium oryziradicis]